MLLLITNFEQGLENLFISYKRIHSIFCMIKLIINPAIRSMYHVRITLY